VLVVTLTEFETDPSGEQVYVSMTLEVEAKPFTGASHCTVLGCDLAAFLDELDSLARTSKGEARMVGGWGEREYVQLTLRPHGSLGHIALHVMLREYQPDTDFRVEGTIVTEPQLLIEFSAALWSAFQAQELQRIELRS
jgi:hypothetical protein